MFEYNITWFLSRHEAHINNKKIKLNKKLNIKKNPVFVQVIVLFAGINDIIHGWTINTVIFPKACKEYYSLLSTFLWVINEDNSCDVASDVGVLFV